MIPAARQQKIINWLMQEGHLSTADLQKRLDVSPMTIWRDLKILEDSGVARRVRGGVEYTASESSRTFDGNLVNITPNQTLPKPITDPHHEAIGRYVARELIKPGDDIILEGGTTVASTIPFIDAPNITMLTNGLNTLALAQVSGTIETVLCCGGVLNQVTQSFIGPSAERFFYSYHVDKVFISAYGYVGGEGFMDPNPLYDSMKKTICSRGRLTIMLLDSSKFGRTGLTRVFDTTDVHIMVTDWEAPQDVVDEIRVSGVDVRIAPKP